MQTKPRHRSPTEICLVIHLVESRRSCTEENSNFSSPESNASATIDMFSHEQPLPSSLPVQARRKQENATNPYPCALFIGSQTSIVAFFFLIFVPLVFISQRDGISSYPARFVGFSLPFFFLSLLRPPPPFPPLCNESEKRRRAEVTM